ncbi:MAG TPA: response regulator [Burkholderiales bacterium]|nr:response regulator [Burkholderiales bacterium]
MKELHMSDMQFIHDTLDRKGLLSALRAFRKGDFSVRLPMDFVGADGEIAQAFNDVVEVNERMAEEFARIRDEVGREGQINQRVRLPSASGSWADCVDSVNTLVGDLVRPSLEVARVIESVAKGDLSQRMLPEIEGRSLRGEFLRIGKVVNTMVDQLGGFASEVSRVAREVGTDGKLGGQAQVPGVAGTWKDLTDNVNLMAANLTGQVRNIAEVTTAVAKGDLSKKITVDVKGEILELKSTINTMVDQLNGFASEVSRVAREVGTDGKLGGQARVPGVAGTWKDLTDNVNSMAASLTNQVRGIAQVVNAVARGDLKRKVVFEAKGEIAALADTINGMIDTLATFGDQVTNVAREVGIEGKLGGQARVPGAAGLWRDLTDNVNQLAANLTTQVRAIAEVATAVTKGDLTRSIMVEAMGEVAVLKDNINEMIRNLKDTTLKNNEQDWLKTNLAKFTQMLQGHSDLVTVSKLVLSELAPLINAQQGVFYCQSKRGDELRLELLAAYASKPNRSLAKTLRVGEGLIGQCAYEKKRILLEDAPADYVRINSGLGSATPLNVIILPVLFEGEVKAVVELASLRRFNETHLSFLEQLTESIGIVFNTIEANMRTEALLEQSQTLTKELQSQQEELKNTNDRLEQQAENLQNSERLLKNQQEELQSTNEELQEKAKLLSEQMQQVAYKNREVEHAKAALEEKAEQLALSSRYKSEFLANMSHELRTPLNSLLILAKLLSDNAGNNLTPKQIDYAQTIYAAGTDLLSLINDILDLAKIESGTVTLDIAPERFSELLGYVERTFRQVAQNKGLGFTVEAAHDLPAVIHTDEKRLQQILKNLLSNAFKFTEQGTVALRIFVADAGWSDGHVQLDAAARVVAFAVTDTGIGIPEAKQKVIFEAFQQVDGTTSRKYGGTGLGLSISRELTRLLGGDIRVESSSGEGSTFTLYLPLMHEPAPIDLRIPPPAPGDARPGSERPGRPAVKPKAGRASARPQVTDDRDSIQPGDLVVLIVEDDDRFAVTLRELARESGFKAVVAAEAGAALNMVKDLAPDAITLDLKLPDMEGWAVLDMLKHDPETRHIPVSVISVEEEMRKYLHMGALGVVQKPAGKDALLAALARTRSVVEHEIKSLLVAAADEAERASIVEALSGESVRIAEASSGSEAIAELREDGIDCLVVGQALRDMSAADLVREIARLQTSSRLPIVMYRADDAGGGEGDDIRKLAEGLVLKSARTVEAVLAETTLFLHQAVSDLPPEKRHQLLTVLRGSAPGLEGKKALIVDDDIRNIFALAGALEQHGMAVLTAENGKDGIEALKNDPDIDVVLMDIMMPELDGYDTIRIMRGLEEFRDLPIIAVTAKAMKGDREKCIEAGASDYISKPVNIEQLLSLLRIRLAEPAEHVR